MEYTLFELIRHNLVYQIHPNQNILLLFYQ
nr:MAG TPA: hypothetical protein [Caudoviricetes sp.]